MELYKSVKDVPFLRSAHISTIIRKFVSVHSSLIEFRWTLTVMILHCNQVVINVMETCDSNSLCQSIQLSFYSDILNACNETFDTIIKFVPRSSLLYLPLTDV